MDPGDSTHCSEMFGFDSLIIIKLNNYLIGFFINENTEKRCCHNHNKFNQVSENFIEF